MKSEPDDIDMLGELLCGVLAIISFAFIVWSFL